MRQLRVRPLIWPFAVAVILASTAALRADEPAPKVHEVVADKFAKQDRDQDKQLSVAEFQAWYGADRRRFRPTGSGLHSMGTGRRETWADRRCSSPTSKVTTFATWGWA